MIEHLKGREKQLLDDWRRQDAEWIALVCLHSGVFMRSQYSAWTGTSLMSAVRLVHRLLSARVATEDIVPTVTTNARLVRIHSRKIYEALGIANVRHRKDASPDVLLRRVLSLDYVIEHPTLPWLPTEAEKVDFCKQMDIPHTLLPKKWYVGAADSTKRYFPIKMPVAAEQEWVTFVYIDPEDARDKSLRTWGDAHLDLWKNLRKREMRIRVVAASRKLDRLARCERLLKEWTAGSSRPKLKEKKDEIARVEHAISSLDSSALADYGGLNGAMRGLVELQQTLSDNPTESLIDEYGFWCSSRLATDGDHQCPAPVSAGNHSAQ